MEHFLNAQLVADQLAACNDRSQGYEHGTIEKPGHPDCKYSVYYFAH